MKSTFSGVDLHTWFAKKSGQLRECMSRCFRMELLVQFPVSQLISQLVSQLVSRNEKVKQTVITMGVDVTAERRLFPPQQLSQLLSSDATYLITGGTRDISLALASWMVEIGP